MGQPHPIEPVSGPLVLYGKGNLGKLAKEYCKYVGQPVIAHTDRNDARGNYEVSVAVCIVTEPYVPIETDLLQTYKQVFPFYDITERFHHIHPLNNGWQLGHISPNVAITLNRWHDDISRAHHLQFLAWRRLREEWTFDEAPVHVKNRYFIPEVTSVLTCKEVFLDCGACYGETIQAFWHRVGNHCKSVIAIEPDLANYSVLREEMPITRAFQYALDQRSGTKRSFHANLGYSSQFAHTGYPVETTALDDLDFDPTFIKLHLEGNELPALKGGIKMLWENRPIITVTVYHNSDGVVKTPLWLMENLSDYRFLFRNHGWCGTGAVVYAIPEERYK